MTAASCRVCASANIHHRGHYKPFTDFGVDVYDCDACGVRFTNRDEHIYEQLHANHPTYLAHGNYAQEVKARYDSGDIAALRSFLDAIPKNAHVIDAIDRLSPGSRVLELGCSAGHLSSYAIAKGHDFFGIDVSETAISRARELFPEGQFEATDGKTLPDATFDLIYHVGTIGCVEDPIGLTNGLLARLNPQGNLVFNAPNRDSVDRFSVPWVRGTTPPDLVTLFPEQFWDRFAGQFAVETRVENGPDYSAIAYHLQRVMGEPDRGRLFVEQPPDATTDATSSDGSAKDYSRAKCMLARLAKLLPLKPAKDDFGIMVAIERPN